MDAAGPLRETARLLGPKQTCHACDYDLRGSRSHICSECGAPVRVPFLFHTEDAMRVAERALRRADIEFDVLVGDQMGAVIQGWSSVPTSEPPVGALWIRSSDAGIAMQVLWNAQLAQEEGGPSTTLVDRANPLCPTCRTSLDGFGEPICPECGRTFVWFEDGDEMEGDIELTCPSCQEDLTGMSDGECPSCHARFLVSNGAARSADPGDGGHEPLDEDTGFVGFAIAVLVFIIFLAFGWTMASWPIGGLASRRFDLGAILILSLVGFLAALVWRRSSRTRSKRPDPRDREQPNLDSDESTP